MSTTITKDANHHHPGGSDLESPTPGCIQNIFNVYYNLQSYKMYKYSTVRNWLHEHNRSQLANRFPLMLLLYHTHRIFFLCCTVLFSSPSLAKEYNTLGMFIMHQEQYNSPVLFQLYFIHQRLRLFSMKRYKEILLGNSIGYTICTGLNSW